MTTPVPEYEGCPWPVDDACLGTGWDDLDQTIKDRAIALASETLRRLTGYRVGGCPITVRPCRSSCTDTTVMPSYWYAGAVFPFNPHINASGVWINGCGCTTDCSCEELCEVVLPGPVGEVYTIMSDGVEVPSTEYTIYGNRLTWTGTGECPWPMCQNLALPDTEVGTFSVTYLNSWPVDGLGAYAAGVLAFEYAQACQGFTCRLPAGVTAVSRSGVSYDIASGAFPDGFTGIREVDAYLSIWNPQALRQSPRVWSPDLRTPRVVR